LEGKLHKLLKQSVTQDLLNQYYEVYHEPPESPLKRLYWRSYRPDILGIYSNNSKLIIVIAECEAKPSFKKTLRKTNQIRYGFSLQKRLNEKHFIFPLLVIPAMNFNKINFLEIRKFWQIWIINNSGKILHKLPHIEL